MGVRVSGHVEVIWRPADDQITDGAPDHVDVKAFLAQPADDPHCIGIHQAQIDPVLFLSINVRFLLYGAVFCCAVSEQQSAIPVVGKIPSIVSSLQ